MAAFVKSLDPNHLLTLGEEGFYSTSTDRLSVNPGYASAQNPLASLSAMLCTPSMSSAAPSLKLHTCLHAPCTPHCMLQLVPPSSPRSAFGYA